MLNYLKAMCIVAGLFVILTILVALTATYPWLLAVYGFLFLSLLVWLILET